VDARFEIHEGTSRVTVTMYDRETGEVLREIPPRRVLDVLAALSGRGLTVDVES
jgi:flagellar protein FlaG